MWQAGVTVLRSVGAAQATGCDGATVRFETVAGGLLTATFDSTNRAAVCP